MRRARAAVEDDERRRSPASSAQVARDRYQVSALAAEREGDGALAHLHVARLYARGRSRRAAHTSRSPSRSSRSARSTGRGLRACRRSSARLRISTAASSGSSSSASRSPRRAMLPIAGWLASRRGSRGPIALGLLVTAGGLTAAAFAPSLALARCRRPACSAPGSESSTSPRTHTASQSSSGSGGRCSRRCTARGASACSRAPASPPARQLRHRRARAVSGRRHRRRSCSRSCSCRGCCRAPRTPRSTPRTSRCRAARSRCRRSSRSARCSLESATMNWSAVFLSGPAHASAAVAAGGVVAYSVAMVAARLAGDRLTARWGVAGLARRGGAPDLRRHRARARDALAGPGARRLRARRCRLRGARAGALSASPRRRPASRRAPASQPSRRRATRAASSTARRSASSRAASA